MFAEELYLAGDYGNDIRDCWHQLSVPMIQKFYSEARHCPHLSKALIIDLWTVCLIHRIPLKFSLYIRIKNVCPLLLNVTFGPFKDVNL